MSPIDVDIVPTEGGRLLLRVEPAGLFGYVDFSLPAAPTIIIELKFGLESADDADLVTNAMPFRVARFSKYVAGIEHI